MRCEDDLKPDDSNVHATRVWNCVEELCMNEELHHDWGANGAGYFGPPVLVRQAANAAVQRVVTKIDGVFADGADIAVPLVQQNSGGGSY